MQHFIKNIILGLVLSVFLFNTNAAKLKSVNYRGSPAISLKGTIRKGDSIYLYNALKQVGYSKHGYKILLLDSPGGLVNEAMLVGDIIRKEKIHTVIPSGAKCASACGSVIFLSGALRTIEYGGLLGQHTCYNRKGANKKCNHSIVEYAMRNIGDPGPVKTFIQTQPQEMVWFTREDADGWGLTKYLGETESKFMRSEPRVLSALGGKPKAQKAWRLDFFGDGFRAFHRTWRDDKKDGEVSLYCFESEPGDLFIDLQIQGNPKVIHQTITDVGIITDANIGFVPERAVYYHGDYLTYRLKIPKKYVLPILQEVDKLLVVGSLGDIDKPTNKDLIYKNYLKGSRKNLIFAANHCANDPSTLNKFGY